MNKRLGKGLDALIPSLNINDDDKIMQIPLSQLRMNPYQPRKNFDESAILELADSIKEHGVIQPIIVRPAIRGFEIIEEIFSTKGLSDDHPKKCTLK